MEPFDSTTAKTTHTSRARPDLWRFLAGIALAIITLCAIISTVTLGQISKHVGDLYNVTAKPHCYLSPNDPRRRDIERNWGKEPTTDGACDKDAKQSD